MVGLDDLKGLFQSKFFYDSYMVQQPPGKKKKSLLLVFIKMSSMLSSEIQLHKLATCMYFFHCAFLCKVDY